MGNDYNWFGGVLKLFIGLAALTGVGIGIFIGMGCCVCCGIYICYIKYYGDITNSNGSNNSDREINIELEEVDYKTVSLTGDDIPPLV
jgi:hypothetical protein